MKKEKQSNEVQLLDLLKRVLPKATDDPSLAGKIYEAVARELKVKSATTAFDKFCSRVALPNLEPDSLEDARRQITETFGDVDVTIKPDRKEKNAAVEVVLPDGNVFNGIMEVKTEAGDDGEQEIKLKSVPFPVCLPGDKELVWLLAKRENLTHEEAGIALSKVEEEFWLSKSGQKLLRDRVERTFPEFISRVPPGMLNEAGLKRHYKTPEPLKVLRAAPKK